jgi:hypothetical protein
MPCTVIGKRNRYSFTPTIDRGSLGGLRVLIFLWPAVRLLGTRTYSTRIVQDLCEPRRLPIYVWGYQFDSRL